MTRTVALRNEPPVPLQTESLAALLADPTVSAPAEWVVQPFFERDTLVSIYGPGKIGKSTMLADIAGHVAAGVDWAGHRVCGGPVLWIDLEQGRRRLARTFETVGPDAAGQIDVWSNLGGPPPLASMRLKIEMQRPVLVVIDSLSKFCQVEDENDNSAWQAALRPLESMARDSGAAVVVIDHDRKGEGEHGRGMRGASSKLAAFDTAIHVKRADATRRWLEGVSREIGDFKFAVERTADGYRAVQSTRNNVVLELLRALGQPVTVAVLHHELKRRGYEISDKSVRNHIEAGVADGTVTSTGTGTKNDPKLFSAAPSTETRKND